MYLCSCPTRASLLAAQQVDGMTGAERSSDRDVRGSQGAWSLPLFPSLSPQAWEEAEVATGGEGVTARVLLLTQAGRGAGLAVVTPGPLSPRFSQALSFLGGRNWREGVRNLGLMSQAIRPPNSTIGLQRHCPSHSLPPGTCPQVRLILTFITPPAPKSWVGAQVILFRGRGMDHLA